MAATVPALDFLKQASPAPPPPVCVVFGDEPFLKRLALGELRRRTLGDDDGQFSLSVVDGEKAQLRDVIDELSTVALFGGSRRMVVIEDADAFVSRCRDALEAYVARPKHSGVLVLEVGSWPASTRLYKALAAAGLQIECKAPSEKGLPEWLVAHGRQQHGVALDRAAAELLVECVGAEMGLLDQELAKLAPAAPAGGKITTELVDRLVVGWRTRSAWDMLDSALKGQSVEALAQLDRLLAGGESPLAVLGQISATLRRHAAAARMVLQAEAQGRRLPPRQAFEQVGVKGFFLQKSVDQLRHLGRARAEQLYRWLLEADLALKGQSSAPARARLVLEMLIAQLSVAAAGPAAASR